MSTATENSIPLPQLPLGGKGRITRFEASPQNRSRLFEMGLTPGATVELVRIAPLGDPIDFKIRGYHLSLRRQEAEGIFVVPLS